LSTGVHEEGLEVDLGDEEVTLARDPMMRPHPKSALVDNEFVEQYRESIKPGMERIEKQISRPTWCGKKIQIHPPASDERLEDSSVEVRKIGLLLMIWPRLLEGAWINTPSWFT
jgi:hypothetical protein